ncbi:NAD(P)-dependent oxidoreductase [Cellulomonas humilata]|uniref:NADH-flavin reductase n=1 Tax=Cellulomonas humilata TaxID=144055 RepID=A0ABU0EF76_9CELL|nr:NAD(P)H-binding protein [Cellulomonas humilata]MDQ0373918.1 putative NADH-flavin reductase [Cellulomonas humilata]
MKLTIIAATGGIGRQILEQATAAGHDVTAVVRDPSRLPRTSARVMTIDLDKDTATLANAVAGADAVLSGLGARTKADEGIATRGTRAIVDAMRTTGSARLVVVSAAPIGTVASPDNPHPPTHDAGDGFFMRHLFSGIAKTLFRAHYADLAAMENVVRASRLDWTIARPPKLTDRALTGTYRTALDQNVRGGWSISRADVADLMLRTLDRPETVGHVVGAAS